MVRLDRPLLSGLAAVIIDHHLSEKLAHGGGMTQVLGPSLSIRFARSYTNWTPTSWPFFTVLDLDVFTSIADKHKHDIPVADCA